MIRSEQIATEDNVRFTVWQIEQRTGETLEVTRDKAEKSWKFDVLTFDVKKDDWVGVEISYKEVMHREYKLPSVLVS